MWCSLVKRAAHLEFPEEESAREGEFEGAIS